MLVTKGGNIGQNSSLCSTCPFLTRVKAVQCWIWAASTLLKSMGRTCGKWQQFVGGNQEYIRTGGVAKLGTTTEKRGHPAEVLTNLSIVYTSCMLEGERCARKIKKKDGKMKPALNTEPGTRKV